MTSEAKPAGAELLRKMRVGPPPLARGLAALQARMLGEPLFVLACQAGAGKRTALFLQFESLLCFYLKGTVPVVGRKFGHNAIFF